jgi:arylsulfatase A-like enzyme
VRRARFLEMGLAALLCAAASAADKPNILVIWGDDVGQSVFRTGLSKVGPPGAALGMQKEDPTIAGLLKNQGYVTGQFGKNHPGDKGEMLPTNHGFDEFFGNLSIISTPRKSRKISTARKTWSFARSMAPAA